ncbi:thioesterase superfamily protein [Thermincola ferriacetica]|uniref:Thioesterase superfamily protein n=1 Tax=Thermincola ferriacetica TaxID=281456 RepID=A0A0L6W4J2_9FIRM|nr:acyl-CoA thioesterase [Thermincola ferriacetica]KNZ70391.1 thioesterase superfamily protein [Thermincola ferriacetica]
MIEKLNGVSEESLKGKPPRASEVQTTELVLPNDTNLLGNLLGGRLMHWMDLAGAMAASRHANSIVATVAVDSLDFRHPVRQGEMVVLKAKLTWVGNTSMEVIVRAYAENTISGNVILTNEAYFTFVALDENGRPKKVPPLVPETEEEMKACREAEERRKKRLQRRFPHV